jgi:hypothetical protein
MYRAAIFLAIGVLCTATCWGQATVENVSPPAVKRGAVTRITVAGSELSQVVGLWTSLPAESVSVMPIGTGDGGQAQFDLKVAENAPLGLYGLRVATVDGLSNVHLFLIDDMPQTAAEKIPLVEGRRQVTLPIAIWNNFREGQMDRFVIQVQAGERISFETVASRLGKDADPLLTIYDSKNRQIVQSDNDVGLFFDSRIEHTFVEAGPYTVAVSDSRYLGSPHWNYLLRMGRFPAARVALPSVVNVGEKASVTLPEAPGETFAVDVGTEARPRGFYHSFRRPGDDASTWVPLAVRDLPGTVESEPNDTIASATPAKLPGILHGCLQQPGDRDFFTFDLVKGQKIDFRAETRTIGSAADIELVLLGSKGNEIRRIDDVLLEEASLSFVAPSDGPYCLEVRELTADGGPAFVYRIEAKMGGPQFQLTSAVADLTIPHDSYQSLPIAVTRTEFMGPIDLSVVGGPPGLELEPNVLPANANEVLCTLKVPRSVAAGLYTLRVEGQAKLEDGRTLSSVAKTQPMIDRQEVNVDLIKHALRENQRFLPPSLTETIALFVTPPASFTFDLPDASVTLARYLHADFPIATTRTAGFDGPITFATRGGPVGKKSQLRIQVYTEIPDATQSQLNPTARIFARNQAQIAKSRIDVDATGAYQGRKVTLSRSFQLDLKTAFEVTAEPAQITLQPGESQTVHLSVTRLSTFQGAVTVEPSRVTGIELPESMTIPADQSSIEFEIKIPADYKPGKFNIRLPSTSPIENYQEETQGNQLQIEVKAKPVEKK